MPAFVNYNGNYISTSDKSPASADCSQTNFIVVTGNAMLNEWVNKEALRFNRVDIQDRIGDAIFTCRFTGDNLSHIRLLDFIKTATRIPVAAKVAPEFHEYTTLYPDQQVIYIDVRFHRLAVNSIYANAVSVADAAGVPIWDVEVKEGVKGDFRGLKGAAVRLWCHRDLVGKCAEVDDVARVGLPWDEGEEGSSSTSNPDWNSGGASVMGSPESVVSSSGEGSFTMSGSGTEWSG